MPFVCDFACLHYRTFDSRQLVVCVVTLNTYKNNHKCMSGGQGSLGRAFGKKIRDDLKLAFDSDSPKWKISAPIPIQHTSLDNVVEIPGDSTAV